ncbi:retinol dehydrogenase 12-like [Sitophilus oryzae]|uniref:Retinol dehydrogenase 12-like n=1 Tax=Sitophilus oryzae TaxID=7048 RepID=A0A6J2XBD5_SITOR|nr:retinol dehydrogenase 12-like [Sitophilus oryzae]
MVGVVAVLAVLVLFLVLAKIYIKLTTGWCRSNVCLVGKTVIVTGSNTGIGYETAADLAKRGAKVILACRNGQRAKDAVQRIINETDNSNVSYRILDLGSLKSVRKFADEINKNEERLDILINNAGLQTVPEIKGLTGDGLQPTMQANYFGHFLLTHLLLGLLKKSAPSRIVNVASMAANYTKFKSVDDLNSEGGVVVDVYGRSKLANILFTIELSEKLKNTKVTTYSLHPGVILTEFSRNVPELFKGVVENVLRYMFKNAIEGAQTTIYCAVEKDIEKYSGQHFHDCHVVKPYKKARKSDLVKSVWKKTEELVKLEKKLI